MNVCVCFCHWQNWWGKPSSVYFSCWVVRGKGQEAKGLPLRPSSVRGDLTWCFWGTCSSLLTVGVWAVSRQPEATCHLPLPLQCSPAGKLPPTTGSPLRASNMFTSCYSSKLESDIDASECYILWCVYVCVCFREKGMPRHLRMFDDAMKRPK